MKKEIKPEEHKRDCIWGNSDCLYKLTHHYCPHEEHKSLKCKCFEPPTQNLEWEKELIKIVGLSDDVALITFIRTLLQESEAKAYQAGKQEGIQTSNSGRKMYEMGKKEGLKRALEMLPEEKPEKLGTYGTYDQLHVQSNIGFNEAVAEIRGSIKKEIDGKGN